MPTLFSLLLSDYLDSFPCDAASSPTIRQGRRGDFHPWLSPCSQTSNYFVMVSFCHNASYNLSHVVEIYGSICSFSFFPEIALTTWTLTTSCIHYSPSVCRLNMLNFIVIFFIFSRVPPRSSLFSVFSRPFCVSLQMATWYSLIGSLQKESRMQIVLPKCFCNVDAAAASGYGRRAGKGRRVSLVTCGPAGTAPALSPGVALSHIIIFFSLKFSRILLF